MRNGILAAVAILMTCAASVWSQDSASSAYPPINTVSEMKSANTDLLPDSLRDNGEEPWLSDNSSRRGARGNGNQYWISAEALLWSIKPANVPPLASTGAIGPGTAVLFGGQHNSDWRAGGRFTAGTWLDDGRTGIEGSYFFLRGNENFNVSSSGAPGSLPLARPFFNVITGLQDRQQVAIPGISSGSIGISSGSMFQGAELNLLRNLFCCETDCCVPDCCVPNCSGDCGATSCSGDGVGGDQCCISSGYRVDLIGGFRYLGLDESLTIAENITFLPGAPFPIVPGTTITVIDRFATSNNFYGGQIGARGEWWRDQWFVNVTGKVALGTTHQVVRISGSTDFTIPPAPTVQQPGGLLALPTNMGTRSRDVFGFVPEIGFNVGRQVNDNVRVFAGYSFLYWNSVVRPADQIDYVINPTQLPTPTGPGVLVGAARPAPMFRDTDLWAQGINLGVEFRR